MFIVHVDNLLHGQVLVVYFTSYIDAYGGHCDSVNLSEWLKFEEVVEKSECCPHYIDLNLEVSAKMGCIFIAVLVEQSLQ